MPGDHPVHLSLPIPTTIDRRSAHLHLSVTVGPLLAQHDDERGEDGNGQAQAESGMEVDGGGIGVITLRKSSVGTTGTFLSAALAKILRGA